MLKTYPWEELHEIFLAPAVKDVILMAQDYILRIREGDDTRIWLALAEQ